MFMVENRDQDNPAYTLSQILWIDDVDDIDVLRCAVVHATREAVLMTSTIHRTDNGDVGFLTDQHDPADLLEVVDLSAETDPDSALDSWRTTQLHTPIHLLDHSVGWHALIIMGEGRVGYFSALHHAWMDGFAGALILTRILEIYVRYLGGLDAGPTPFPEYRSVVANSPVAGPEIAEFWKDYLGAAPDHLGLTTRSAPPHPIPEVRSHRIGGLRDIDRGSWIHRCFAAVASYYARFLDSPDTLLGSPRANRRTREERATPAMFVSTLPVRARVDPDATVGDVVAFLRKELALTAKYSAVDLSEPSSMPTWVWRAGRAYGPLVNVIPFDVQPDVPGVECELEFLGRGPVDDVSTFFTPSGDDDVDFSVFFNPSRYSPAECDLHARRLTAHIQAWADATTDTPVADLPFLLADDVRAAVVATDAVPEPGESSVLGDVSIPDYGTPLTAEYVAALARSGGATGPTMARVCDSLGRLTPLGATGRIEVGDNLGSPTPTDVLVRVGSDGWHMFGMREHQIRVRGTLVNMDEQAALARSHPDVISATSVPSTPAVVVTIAADADADQVVRALRLRLQRGVGVSPVT